MGIANREEFAITKKQRSKKRSKVIFIIVGGLIVVIICLLGLLIHFILENKSYSFVCTTETCVQSAAVYLRRMDKSMDPCENFYQYSCGGYIANNFIPEDLTMVSTWDGLDVDVLVKCKAIFERAPGKNEPKAVSSVRNYYKSCVDLDAINQLDAKPLTDILTDIGGWPVLGSNPGGNWQESSYDFINLKTRIARNFDSGNIFSVYIYLDVKNNTRRVLTREWNPHIVLYYQQLSVAGYQIDQPGLSLDREYYLDANKTKEMEAYKKYMVDVAVALGAESTNASEQMQEILDLESEIARMLVPWSERRDSEKLYNVFTLQELRTAYPLLDWDSYFNQLLDGDYTPLPDDERIINKSPDFLRNVTEWLANKPRRVIANYLVWEVVESRLNFLSQRFLDIKQAYRNTMYGTSKSAARWKRCMENVHTKILKYAAGRLYVLENFPANAKEKTLQMVDNLKGAFKDMLHTNDWMDEEDKKRAAEKADAMKVKLGYPDWILNDTKLDDYYKEVLDFRADEFMGNSLKYLKKSLEVYFASLRKPVEQDSFGSGPVVVNAFYYSNKNKMVVPAGILQPHLYHQDMPWYSNYGGIGTFIGHEIAHGFDEYGRQFDEVGNLETWWSNNSISKFKERAQCFVDQYSGFVMPETGENLNGEHTQNENIADNCGLKESFKAFKDNTSPQPPLPGLDLTEDQMFFLSFAQVWCTVTRPEEVSSNILDGEHSPGRYRVIGAAQNSKDFAKAFNCPVNSYMNPAEKCEVW